MLFFDSLVIFLNTEGNLTFYFENMIPLILLTIKGINTADHPHQGASQVVLVVKNPHANAGDARDMGSISGLGRSPGGRNSNPLQYS